MIIKPALKLAVLCLLLTGSFARAGQESILVLGDSISAAYGMSVQQGWVALLAGRLADSHPELSVVNASISGETTAGALRRLPQLLTAHSPSTVLVELGANDGLRGYPIMTLRSNLEEIVTLSQAAGAQVVLLQIEIPPNYGSRYTSAFHDSYALIAERTSSTLAPFMLEGVAGNPELIQADGLHPTVEAQGRILENVSPTLMKLLD